MAVTKQDVDNVSALARLYFSDKEKEELISTLNSILDYFDKLSELDTETVEPLTHILPVQNVVRGDEVTESFSRETALQNAPRHERGLFVIPRVIE
ncbi:Asp-tRNA(Asn)/Glu-tRNA(Gln) amidotransferase subunit GatC [Candidatus Latescibacterota bacterium]